MARVCRCIASSSDGVNEGNVEMRQGVRKNDVSLYIVFTCSHEVLCCRRIMKEILLQGSFSASEDRPRNLFGSVLALYLAFECAVVNHSAQIAKLSCTSDWDLLNT